MSAISDLRTKLGHEFAEALRVYHEAAQRFHACDGREPGEVVGEAYAARETAAYELCCAVQRAANPMGN